MSSIHTETKEITMSKESHPYFIPNDPDRPTTATLLVGTAEEFGIDQRGIQVTVGGFNVSKEVAEAIYGEDFDADADSQEAVLTGQVPVSEPASPDVAPSATDYSDWDYADLKAEVSRRQIETEDNKAKTLAAALTAADADLDADTL